MARSAVLTQPSRIFLPISAASLALALVFGAFTADWLGISLYLMLMVVAGFAGVIVAGFRVNDTPEPIPANAPPPGIHEVPRVPLPAGGAWPFMAALAVSLVLLGFVAGPLAAFFGIGVALVTVTGWLARMSSDTTGREINLLPIGLPVVGLFFIATLMFLMSRVLLAVPEATSTLIALVVAILILGTATLFALRPSVSTATMVAILAISGIAMLAGGIVAAGAGERTIEHHGAEAGHGAEGGEEGHEGEGGAGTGGSAITAVDIAFDHEELTFAADTDAELVFRNEDEGIPHNVSIYEGEDASAPAVLRGDIISGPSEITYQFTTPAPGEYLFQCDVHPNMNGTVQVS